MFTTVILLSILLLTLFVGWVGWKLKTDLLVLVKLNISIFNFLKNKKPEMRMKTLRPRKIWNGQKWGESVRPLSVALKRQYIIRWVAPNKSHHLCYCAWLFCDGSVAKADGTFIDAYGESLSWRKKAQHARTEVQTCWAFLACQCHLLYWVSIRWRWKDGSADHLARAGTSFSACCSRLNDLNPDLYPRDILIIR